jgi:hypothetical protein
MALCSEKVKRALNQVSGGLCYFTAEAKHAQLLDVQKTLSEVADALSQSEVNGAPVATDAEIRKVYDDAYDNGPEDGFAPTLRAAYDYGRSTVAAQPPNALPARILTMCKKRGWDLSWSSRGVYLHLEASELIEALRGKHGDPLSEAADVLLVLMSITENAGIPWGNVLEQTAVTCARLEVCDPYPGEERGALTQSALSDALIQAKWPPAAQPAQSSPTAAPHVNNESEYTDQEWAEINRWEQEPSATQPASPVLPACGLVERLRTSVRQLPGVYLLDDECQVAIREVAAWLDLEGYNRAANDLRQEAGR